MMNTGHWRCNHCITTMNKLHWCNYYYIIISYAGWIYDKWLTICVSRYALLIAHWCFSVTIHLQNRRRRHRRFVAESLILLSTCWLVNQYILAPIFQQFSTLSAKKFTHGFVVLCLSVWGFSAYRSNIYMDNTLLIAHHFTLLIHK